MTKSNLSQKKLKAIVFTDMADFTTISAQDEQKALDLIQKQNEIIKPIVEKHKGEWLKEIGDGLLFSFDSSLEAVRCSIEIQETLKDVEDLNIRIGIHQGDIFVKDGDVFGDDVNIASRIEGFAPIGGISLSDKIHKDISGVSDIKTSFIGHRNLKGVEQETKIRCISSNALPQHRKQYFPLIVGYLSLISGIFNSVISFSMFIFSLSMGWKLPHSWWLDFLLSFVMIFIGYSCISYVKGLSIKSQRLFLYLGYMFFIMGIIGIFLPDDILFYSPYKLDEAIIRPSTIEIDSLKVDTINN